MCRRVLLLSPFKAKLYITDKLSLEPKSHEHSRGTAGAIFHVGEITFEKDRVYGLKTSHKTKQANLQIAGDEKSASCDIHTHTALKEFPLLVTGYL